MLHTYVSQVKLQSAKVSLSWCRDGIFDHEVTHVFLKLVQDEKEARVVGVTEKPRTKSPPHALHTVELLRMASSKLHIGPKQTMDMAERLYISVSEFLTNTGLLQSYHSQSVLTEE